MLCISRKYFMYCSTPAFHASVSDQFLGAAKMLCTVVRQCDGVFSSDSASRSNRSATMKARLEYEKGGVVLIVVTMFESIHWATTLEKVSVASGFTSWKCRNGYSKRSPFGLWICVHSFAPSNVTTASTIS